MGRADARAAPAHRPPARHRGGSRCDSAQWRGSSGTENVIIPKSKITFKWLLKSVCNLGLPFVPNPVGMTIHDGAVEWTADRSADALMTRPSEQGQDERLLGGPSDPLDPQEAPSEAPQSHRVNPLSSQEEALARSHPMGLMGHRGLAPPICKSLHAHTQPPSVRMRGRSDWAFTVCFHSSYREKVPPPAGAGEPTNLAWVCGFAPHETPWSG